MAKDFGFFPDETYGPDDFTTYFRDFYSNGIKAEDTSYFAVSESKGMDLTVKSGIAYIDGHFYRPHDNLTVTLAESDTEFTRIDLVEIKCDYVAKKLYVDVITGEPSETPTVPKLQRDAAAYCLGLAAVTVAANASEITKADIKDLRFDENYCGMVVGKINTISTAALFAQYEAQWELLKAGCAQDAEAVIAAWNALNTVKSVNGIKPVNGNVEFNLDQIPDGETYRKIQICTGQISVPESSDSSSYVITFPKAFTAVPTVLCTSETSQYNITSVNSVIQQYTVSKTGFTVKPVWTSKIHWVAILIGG